MSGPGVAASSVRVEPELWEKARTKAAQQGDNLSEILRQAIRDYIEGDTNDNQ